MKEQGRASGRVEGKERLPWWQNLIPPFLLTLFTTLVYWSSLKYPFQFDDIANISKKFCIRFDNPLARWWNGTRWLGDWLNRINYEIGQLNPFSYRLVNLAIHIVTGLLIFYLVCALCRRLVARPFFFDNATILGFVTAALFLLHPIQTQTVSYVIQARIEGLASLFVILLIFCFVKALTAKHVGIRCVSTGLLFGFSLLAWGTKEIVVVVPFLLLLVDWFFLARESWDEFKSHIWLHVLFDIYFFALTMHYMSVKFTVDVATLKTVTGNNRGNVLTEGAYDIITPWQFLISEFKVVLHYIWIFIWPFDASVEYDWRLVPGFFSFECLAPLFVLITLYGTALYGMIKKTYSYVAFGLLWFLICMVPRTSIIPSPELVCDYKTYLASFGLLFILAVFMVVFVKKIVTLVDKITPTISLYMAASSILFVPIGVAAFMHNTMWESSVIFWARNIEKAPMKARAYNNYGVALNEVGRIDESIKAYQRAIDLDKNYSDPLSNIAVAYCAKNETDKAIDALKLALNITPNYPEAYNNLGSLLIQKKNYDEAEHMLTKAIQLRGYYGKAHYNLGRLYIEKNQPELAWNSFKRAVEGDFDNPEGFFTFAQMSMRLNKFAEAASAFEQVIARGCSKDPVLFGLANAYYMLGHYEKAEVVYKKLVRGNPQDGRYMYNLAETFVAKKEYAQAIELFQKVTGLPQPLPQSFFRVAFCLENLQRFDEAQSYLAGLLKIKASDEFTRAVAFEMKRIASRGAVANKNTQQA